MIVYLDACALSRLFDPRTQSRVREEAEAMEEFFRWLAADRVRWVAGEVLHFEARRNSDSNRRHKVLEMFTQSSDWVGLTASVTARGSDLERVGYGSYDALHLASAEACGADFLITTDDRFLRRAGRGAGNPTVSLINPIDWRKGVA